MLCVLSLAPVRRLSHEFFYTVHVIAALVFLATCYLHFEALLGSWAYLHASAVVVGVAFLHRLGVVGFFSRGFTRPDVARLESLADGAVAVEIEVKGGMRWSAGQHVFVRFLTLHPWSTHPFSLASLDPWSLLDVADISRRTMRLVLRPHSGLTARLAALARTNPSRTLPVLLDGPYGPSSLAPILHGADSVLLIAGGTGMSFVAPVLAALLGLGGGATELHVVREVRVVWAVPHEACLGWFAVELEGALDAFERARRLEREKGASGESLGEVGRAKSAPPSSSREALVGPTLRKVRVELYVTRDEPSPSGEAKGADSSSSAAKLDKLEHMSVLRGSRPDVGRIVDEEIKHTSGRLAVVSASLFLSLARSHRRTRSLTGSLLHLQPAARPRSFPPRARRSRVRSATCSRASSAARRDRARARCRCGRRASSCEGRSAFSSCRAVACNTWCRSRTACTMLVESEKARDRAQLESRPACVGGVRRPPWLATSPLSPHTRCSCELASTRDSYDLAPRTPTHNHRTPSYDSRPRLIAPRRPSIDLAPRHDLASLCSASPTLHKVRHAFYTLRSGVDERARGDEKVPTRTSGAPAAQRDLVLSALGWEGRSSGGRGGSRRSLYFHA